jgi:hypothetical protein
MSTATPRMIIQRYEGFGGNFVDSDYLGASYKTGAPHVFENTLAKIYSSKNRFFTGKPLLGMTGAKTGATVEIESEIFRWALQGAEYKCARVMENLESGVTAPGLNNTTFRVKLDLPFYDSPDVLMGEDPEYPVEIVSKISEGTGTIYTLRLQGDDPGRFFPPQYLEVGREFSKVWTSVSSEYNDEFGTQQYPESFKLEGQVGAFAQKLTVTDKAMRQSGRLGIEFIYPNPRTNKKERTKAFMPMAEAMMHEELHRGMEAQMWFGKKQTRPGTNGYWKKTGSGIREILKEGHTEYYNGPLTENRLKDYLMSVLFSREDEGNRAVVAMTGTLGSIMFHDMLAAEASSFLTVDTHFIRDYNAGLRGKHLSYGAQFRHYQGPEGIEVTLVKNPMYDNRQYCKRMHPIYSEFPVDSARFTFLDFGSNSAGEANITMVKVKDTYRYGYVMGTVGPNGPVQGGQAGALKAGYDLFVEGTGGIWMKDPTRGGELIFDFEY